MDCVGGVCCVCMFVVAVVAVFCAACGVVCVCWLWCDGRPALVLGDGGRLRRAGVWSAAGARAAAGARRK